MPQEDAPAGATVAELSHHGPARHRGGTDAPENLQSFCQACHEQKTAGAQTILVSKELLDDAGPAGHQLCGVVTEEGILERHAGEPLADFVFRVFDARPDLSRGAIPVGGEDLALEYFPPLDREQATL